MSIRCAVRTGSTAADDWAETSQLSVSTAAAQAPTTSRRPRGPAAGRPTGGNVITEADELLTNDPLALLIGMVQDQQIG